RPESNRSPVRGDNILRSSSLVTFTNLKESCFGSYFKLPDRESLNYSLSAKVRFAPIAIRPAQAFGDRQLQSLCISRWHNFAMITNDQAGIPYVSRDAGKPASHRLADDVRKPFAY